MPAKLITSDDVTEYENARFCTEASDIGIRPGEAYPSRLETTLGNKQPFLLVTVGENIVNYRQAFGCISLRVFND